MGPQQLSDSARALDVWRNVAVAHGGFSSAETGTRYSTVSGNTVASGGNWVGLGSPAGVVPIIASNWAVVGKTTKLRIIVSTTTNATAPTNTITHSLRSFTVAGAAGAQTVTLDATAVAPVAVASPSASTVTVTEGTEVVLPADGNYTLVAALGGAGAANSIRAFVATLQIRHV